jgi:hypothetical protein
MLRVAKLAVPLDEKEGLGLSCLWIGNDFVLRILSTHSIF